MKGYIVAAGEGVRMRPLTTNLPKPLLPIAGKPFLQHLLETLRTGGITDLTVLVGWRGDRIRERFGDGRKYGVKLSYLEQERRLGTADAVGRFEPLADGPFLCVNGDIVLSPEALESLLAQHRRQPGTTVGLAAVEEPRRYGVVRLEQGRIVDLVEKPESPESNLVNAGAYIFHPEIFEAIRKTERSPRGELEVTDSLKLLMARQPIYGSELPGPWVDVARPWELLDANEILMRTLQSRVEGTVDEGATLHGPVVVAREAHVRAGSYIEGPVIIDEEAEVGPNCYLRPSTYIGRRCKVGAACEVKNSIVMDDTKFPHHNYVGDSVIGERCNFGAGTKVANLRLDEQPVPVIVDGEKVSSGRRKLGAIIGDDVKTGINASIDSGSIIGEETFIGLGATVRGTIAPRSRLY